MSQMDNLPDITMDAASLTREEVYSDGRVGTIRKLIPVLETGQTDDSRPVQYVGSTQILTPAGPLPLNFELQGESLAEAVAGFADAARAAVEHTMQELKEMQRQQASSIVVPGREGGKIQIP